MYADDTKPKKRFFQTKTKDARAYTFKEASQQRNKTTPVLISQNHQQLTLRLHRRRRASRGWRSHRPNCTQMQSSIFSPQATQTTVAVLAAGGDVRKAAPVQSRRNKGILCANDQIYYGRKAFLACSPCKCM